MDAAAAEGVYVTVRTICPTAEVKSKTFTIRGNGDPIEMAARIKEMLEQTQ